MEIIQVSATSSTAAVAQAIASVIHEYRCAEVQAVGAEAVNQAMHALTLASGYLQHDGIPVTFVPQFKRVVIENKQRTVIKFMIQPKASARLSSTSSSEAWINADLPRV